LVFDWLLRHNATVGDTFYESFPGDDLPEWYALDENIVPLVRKFIEHRIIVQFNCRNIQSSEMFELLKANAHLWPSIDFPQMNETSYWLRCHQAIISDDLEIVKMCLSQLSPKSIGRHCFMGAFNLGHVDMAQYLLSNEYVIFTEEDLICLFLRKDRSRSSAEIMQIALQLKPELKHGVATAAASLGNIRALRWAMEKGYYRPSWASDWLNDRKRLAEVRKLYFNTNVKRLLRVIREYRDLAETAYRADIV
jgi:hypothetical protein